MRFIRCDSCGVEIERVGLIVWHRRVNTEELDYDDIHLDLCGKCDERFRSYIREGMEIEGLA